MKKILTIILMGLVLLQCSSSSSLGLKAKNNVSSNSGLTGDGTVSSDSEFYNAFKTNLVNTIDIVSKKTINLGGNIEVKSNKVYVQERDGGLHLYIENGESAPYNQVYESAHLKIISATEAFINGGAFVNGFSFAPLTVQFTLKIRNGAVWLDHSDGNQLVAYKSDTITFPTDATTQAEFEAFFREILGEYEWGQEGNQVNIPNHGLYPATANVDIITDPDRVSRVTLNIIGSGGDGPKYYELYMLIDEYVSIREAKVEYSVAYGYSGWQSGQKASIFLTEKGLHIFSVEDDGVNHILTRGRKK